MLPYMIPSLSLKEAALLSDLQGLVFKAMAVLKDKNVGRRRVQASRRGVSLLMTAFSQSFWLDQSAEDLYVLRGGQLPQGLGNQ